MRKATWSASLVLALFTGGAHALPISTSDAPFTITYNGFTDDGPISGLSASVVFKDFAFNYNAGDNETSVTFKFDITNTSGGFVTASRVSGLAFNTNPNVIVDDSTVSGLFNNVNSGNYPNSIDDVEFCFVNIMGNSCAGGGGTGVEQGQTSSNNEATLRFAGELTSILFDNFYVRYQSIECQQTCSGSATGTGTDTPRTSVPEPGTVLLLGTGLLGLSFLRRRRQQRI